MTINFAILIKKLQEGAASKEEIDQLLEGFSSGQLNLAHASGDKSIAIGGNVIRSIIITGGENIQISADAIRELFSKEYVPPKLPQRGVLPKLGYLPPGSRLNFVRNTNFTGRKGDLIKIANHYFHKPEKKSDPETSGVFLTSGIGGIGKTQMAIEFCYRYGRFFQGIHWIQADQDIESQIADCGFRMGLTPWPETLPEQVNLTTRTWETEPNRLIVFDNLESPDILKNWIPRLGGNKILATSRRDRWPSNLSIKNLPIKVLGQDDSRKLLKNNAPRLDDVNDKSLDILSERLGYLPLALYLAGNYLNDRGTYTVEEFLKELNERGKGISHSALTTWQKELGPTDRVPNIIATFNMSWERLGESREDRTAKMIAIAAGYCAPNIPIPLSIFYGLQSEGNKEFIDLALRRLYQVGLFQSGPQSLPYIHSLIAEYTRSQAKATIILDKLAKVLVTFTNEVLSTKLPVSMNPYFEHTGQVVFWTKDNGLPITSNLLNNLGRYLRVIARYEDAKTHIINALEIDKKSYGKDHPAVATGLSNLATVLQQLGDLEGAKQHNKRALKINTKAYGEDNPCVATSLNNLGRVLRQLGDLEGAKQRHERALEIYTKAYEENHPDFATSLNNLAEVLRQRGDLEGAKQRFEQALEIDTKVYGKDHPSVAIRLNNLALVLQQLGDLEGAKQHIERALEINTKAYGEDHPNIATNLNNMALVLHDLGNFKGAKLRFERALEIDTKVYGEEHPDVATDLGNLAGVLQDLGNLEGAKQHFERALEISTTVYREDHPTVAIRLNNLAGILRQLGNLEGAKQCYERALEIYIKAYGEDHPDVAISLGNLALVLQQLGDLEGAKQRFERALEIYTKVYGEDHSDVAIVLGNLAGILRQLGDLEDAKQCFERALGIDTKVYGEGHLEVARDMGNLAFVLQDLGNLAGAKQRHEQALSIFKQSFPANHPSIIETEKLLKQIEKEVGL